VASPAVKKVAAVAKDAGNDAGNDAVTTFFSRVAPVAKKCLVLVKIFFQASHSGCVITPTKINRYVPGLIN